MTTIETMTRTEKLERRDQLQDEFNQLRRDEGRAAVELRKFDEHVRAAKADLAQVANGGHR